MSLIRMSVSGGLLVLAVLVVRSLFLDRLPRRLFPALWLVVIARLLLPVRIPIRLPVQERVEAAVSAVSDLVTPVPHTAAVPVTPAVSGGAAATAPAASSVPVLPTVWAAVALALAAYFLISWLRCRREFSFSVPVENDFVSLWRTTHPLRRRLEVRELADLPGPLTFGILRPVILFPKGADWQDGERMRYALYHEYIHVRRFDAIRKLLACAALCLHWFNPLVWVLYALHDRDIEHACDEQVLHHYGVEGRRAYALSLLDMEEQKRRSHAAFTANFSKNILKERIDSIMKFKKTTKLSRLIAVILTLVMAVAALSSTVALAAGEPEITDEDIALAYSDLDAAQTDAEREAILAARNKIIFSKSWTVNGKVGTLREDGTIELFPEFYDLFPSDWQIPKLEKHESTSTSEQHDYSPFKIALTADDLARINSDAIPADTIEYYRGYADLPAYDPDNRPDMFCIFKAESEHVGCIALSLPGETYNAGFFDIETDELVGYGLSISVNYGVGFEPELGKSYGCAISTYSTPGEAYMYVASYEPTV